MKTLADLKRKMIVGSKWMGRNYIRNKDMGVREVSKVNSQSFALKDPISGYDSWLEWPKTRNIKFNETGDGFMVVNDNGEMLLSYVFVGDVKKKNPVDKNRKIHELLLALNSVGGTGGDNSVSVASGLFDDALDDLVKGGEGSRGGKVTGHTSGGKPIYSKEGAQEHSKLQSHHQVKANTSKRMFETAREDGNRGEALKHKKEMEEHQKTSDHHGAMSIRHTEGSNPHAVKDRFSEIGKLAGKMDEKMSKGKLRKNPSKKIIKSMDEAGDVKNNPKKGRAMVVGSHDGYNYLVKVDSLSSNDFFKHPFGRQIDDLKKLDSWMRNARSTYVDTKRKASLPAIKKWVAFAKKDLNAVEFYVKWKPESEFYKDDSVKVYFTVEASDAELDDLFKRNPSKKIIKSMDEAVELSLSAKGTKELDASFDVYVDGKYWKCYSVNVAHTEVGCYCNEGYASFVVDTNGSKYSYELYDWEENDVKNNPSKKKASKKVSKKSSIKKEEPEGFQGWESKHTENELFDFFKARFTEHGDSHVHAEALKNVRQEIKDSLQEDSGPWGEKGEIAKVEIDGEEFYLISDIEEMERIAVEYVSNMLNDEPETFSQSFLQQHLYMPDTDKRVFANEDADSLYDEKDDDEILEEYLEENVDALFEDEAERRFEIEDYTVRFGDEEDQSDFEANVYASEWHGGQFTELYKLSSSGMIDDKDDLVYEIEKCIDSVKEKPDSYEEGELDKLEAFVDWANENITENEYDYEKMKDELRSEHVDYVEKELSDPIQYLVHDQGIYTIEQLMKSNLVSIDIESAAQAAVNEDGAAHFLSSYDGNYETTKGGIVVIKGW